MSTQILSHHQVRKKSIHTYRHYCWRIFIRYCTSKVVGSICLTHPLRYFCAVNSSRDIFGSPRSVCQRACTQWSVPENIYSSLQASSRNGNIFEANKWFWTIDYRLRSIPPIEALLQPFFFVAFGFRFKMIPRTLLEGIHCYVGFGNTSITQSFSERLAFCVIEVSPNPT